MAATFDVELRTVTKRFGSFTAVKYSVIPPYG